MELDERKIAVRQDQLEEVYRLVHQITSLPSDDPAYSLGYAKATANRILPILRSMARNKAGGKEVNKDAGD
jgi:hypothetical protein